MVAIGEIISARFKIVAHLGTGGMGAVYAAEHVDLGSHVAIKFLLQNHADNSDIVARFKREARTIAQLDSKHVVKVSDSGEHLGQPFFVMERLAGTDLKSLVKTNGPLPESEAVRLVLQAAEGLAEAHALGVIHRDVKPANLFLAEDPPNPPAIKILDFGIARLTDPTLLPDDHGHTTTGIAIGSRDYMSPEQLTSFHRVDARADIWSLGVVLYWLVSGRLPFEEPSDQELRTAILRDPPRPLTSVCPDVSRGIEAIVHRCLRKDRDARYASMGELIAAMRDPSTQAPSESTTRSVVSGPTGDTHTITVDVGASPALGRITPAARRERRKRRGLAGILAGVVAMSVGILIVMERPAQPRPVAHLESVLQHWRTIGNVVPKASKSPTPPNDSVSPRLPPTAQPLKATTGPPGQTTLSPQTSAGSTMSWISQATYRWRTGPSPQTSAEPSTPRMTPLTRDETTPVDNAPTTNSSVEDGPHLANLNDE